MAGLVGDTHAVLWYIFGDPRLSELAAGAIDAAAMDGDPIYVPSICLVEATYLVEKGRVPLAALDRLTSALRNPQAGFRAAPLDLDVAFYVRKVPRDFVPDILELRKGVSLCGLRIRDLINDCRQSAGVLPTSSRGPGTGVAMKSSQERWTL